MPNHASIHIVGHLGKDPVQEQKGDYTTCRFSVAVTRKRQAGDLTTWWNVTAWRKDAEYAAKYLKKGDVVLVVGEPYLDAWEKDGVKQTMLKIEAQRVTSLSGRDQSSAVQHKIEQQAKAPNAVAAALAARDESEPPF